MTASKAEQLARKRRAIPVGSEVTYWRGAREGIGIDSSTRSDVHRSTRGEFVVWVVGEPGYIALTHVLVRKKARR